LINSSFINKPFQSILVINGKVVNDKIKVLELFCHYLIIVCRENDIEVSHLSLYNGTKRKIGYGEKI